MFSQSRRRPRMVTAERKPTPPEFANEPFVDFSKPENRKAMEDALRKVGAELGREYPLYIAGQKVTTVEKRPSLNPSHPSQVVGVLDRKSTRLNSSHGYISYAVFCLKKKKKKQKQINKHRTTSATSIR